MLVGNHSGGYAIDGAMVLTSTFLELNPPRLAQGMAEKFINRFPVASLWTSRTGQFTGLPEHALRLLEDDRLLMVFPEGARGTAKLYTRALLAGGLRHRLHAAGAADARRPSSRSPSWAAARRCPPSPTCTRLGKLVGVPYIPLTPYLLPAAAARAAGDSLRRAAHLQGHRRRGGRRHRRLRGAGEGAHRAGSSSRGAKAREPEAGQHERC